jgi:hypothetical protein
MVKDCIGIMLTLAIISLALILLMMLSAAYFTIVLLGWLVGVPNLGLELWEIGAYSRTQEDQK